jgi:hypothetical protein
MYEKNEQNRKIVPWNSRFGRFGQKPPLRDGRGICMDGEKFAKPVCFYTGQTKNISSFLPARGKKEVWGISQSREKPAFPS